MKKMPARLKSGTKKRAPKRSASVKTVDDYLAAVPQPARTTLEKVSAAIRSVVPAETSEVITYKIPASNISKCWFGMRRFPTTAVYFPQRR